MAAGRLEGKVVLLTGIGGGMGRVTARLFAREGATVVGSDLDPDSAARDGPPGRGRRRRDRIKRARGPGQPGRHRALGRGHGRDATAASTFSTTTPACRDSRRSPRERRGLPVHDPERAGSGLARLPGAWPHLARRRRCDREHRLRGRDRQGARALPQAAHAAAKGAVIALTRQLAAEGVAVGIRVNCVSPASWRRRRYSRCSRSSARTHRSPRSSSARSTASRGTRCAVAYAGLYLASDEAKWVTGIEPRGRRRSQRDHVGRRKTRPDASTAVLA